MINIKNIYLDTNQNGVKEFITEKSLDASDWVTDKTVGALERWLDSKTEGIKLWFLMKLKILGDCIIVYGIQLLQIYVVCYLIYLAFRMSFYGKCEEDYKSLYMTLMVYTVTRLFWKVVFFY